MKYLFFISPLFLLFLFFRSFYLSSTQQIDLESFLNKLQNKKNYSPSFQITKKEVEKEIFFLENGKRLECKILSEHSRFLLKEKQTMEKLKNFQCFLQEKISPEQPQQMKYFSAEKGIYFFSTHHFFSEKVYIAFMNVSEQTLPKKIDLKQAYFTGTADHIDLFFHPKKSFTAQHIHADFSPKDFISQ